MWDCCAIGIPNPRMVVRLLCCQYTKTTRYCEIVVLSVYQTHEWLWDCCVVSIPNPRMAVRLLCCQYTKTTRGCEIVVLSVCQNHTCLWNCCFISIPNPRMAVRLLCCQCTTTTHDCEISSCHYTKITHGFDIVMLSILDVPMCLSSLNGLLCSG